VTHPLHEAVSALLRQVAADIVLPSFRNLAAADIEQKAPDDLVTAADHASEMALAAGLAALDPAARIVGEEAVAADASLLEGLERGRVWLIDPIDGTNNYATGRTPFGLMLAVVEDGTTQAGWIYDPVAERMCHAVRGGGAFVNGAPVRTAPGTRPRLGMPTYFMTEEEQRVLLENATATFEVVPMQRCAAHTYAELATGGLDAAIFRRALPWDHAAGALLLAEAGGACQRLDGADYAVADQRTGLIGAASPDLWKAAQSVV
jgi:fructose-1,6-bisphosphatase/inositol monophosphatase family enzyme